ncbi:MAG: cation-translocating P-type ATPase [Minisyncoccota bacterium]
MIYNSDFKFWSNSVEEVLVKLETSVHGLSSKEVENRLGQFGRNIFKNKEKVGPFSIFIKQFSSPLIFLLLGAVVLTIILSEWIDASVILCAIIINVGLGFYREYHAENTLDSLVTYIKDRTRVIRDGREQEIDSTTIVPGDIIKLSYGVRVPADALIIHTTNLMVDEAILTGESLPVSKEACITSVTSLIAERKNVVHAGTLVVEGFALAVVYATGNNTEVGKIAHIVLSTERAETPIQKGVNKLAWIIFSITLFIVVFIFALGVYRGEEVLEMLILSVAVAVGAVPEALPIALTVILSIGAERIASKKGIVRTLAAAETLGSTTLIMTDKTGTLTLADMQLVGIFTTKSIIQKPENSSDTKHFSLEQKELLEFAFSNIDIVVENPEDKKSDLRFKGRPFEVNIAKACVQNNIDLSFGEESKASLIIPFNSTHKFSVADLKNNYVVMGAPDILLKRSDLDKESYVAVETWINQVSVEGKRLIGLGILPKSKSGEIKKPYDVKDITFIGILAFYDPIREEVPSAIKSILESGIKMVLVTGDLKGTALSVSKSLNWHVKEEEVLTGDQIQALNDNELLAIISSIKIFARVTPEDKLRIGQLYQKLGEVVAMTGDGVNDTPALKAMDIGISLGSGSDVAKNTADMVLLDDNFKTITLAIIEGRKILSNIRKTFVYLMSNSLDEVFVIGGALIIGLALPISALQIIWVNFFTGSFPALSFAFDEDFDKHQSSLKSSSGLIFTNEVTFITFGVGVSSSVLLFIMYYFLLELGFDLGIVRSVFFVCFSSYILAVSFSFRSLYLPIFSYNPFSNKRLNISVIFASLILIATVTVPQLKNIFGLVSIPPVWIWFIFGWIILNVGLVEIAKYLLRVYNRTINSV